MKLTEVNYEMPVNVTAEKAWEVLASYGDVGDFHTGIKSSEALNGSPTYAEKGADRICVIPNGKKNIIIREKITDINFGNEYTYNVYDWENFPLARMHNTFGVRKNGSVNSIIYQRTLFRLKPGFLTAIMKGKLKSGARDTLIGYKHFMETGEPNVDMKILKKKYRGL